MIRRTMMVIATAAILILAICAGVRPNSPLMTGISGAQANHAKKQTKKAIQVRWKARICGVENENSLMLVALLAMVVSLKTKTSTSLPGRRWQCCPDAVVRFAGPPLDQRFTYALQEPCQALFGGRDASEGSFRHLAVQRAQ